MLARITGLPVTPSAVARRAPTRFTSWILTSIWPDAFLPPHNPSSISTSGWLKYWACPSSFSQAMAFWMKAGLVVSEGGK